LVHFVDGVDLESDTAPLIAHFSMIWRISSMPRLEAPSISRTSIQLPAVISRH
jgi:hypothetical protein